MLFLEPPDLVEVADLGIITYILKKVQLRLWVIKGLTQRHLTNTCCSWNQKQKFWSLTWGSVNMDTTQYGNLERPRVSKPDSLHSWWCEWVGLGQHCSVCRHTVREKHQRQPRAPWPWPFPSPRHPCIINSPQKSLWACLPLRTGTLLPPSEHL